MGLTMKRQCLYCEDFKERTFFPRTGGTSGKCHCPKSPKYGQWMVGAWGCTITATEGNLFE